MFLTRIISSNLFIRNNYSKGIKRNFGVINNRLYEHKTKEFHPDSGVISALPKQYKHGLMKLMINISGFILLGSFITQTIVSVMEKNQLFIVEDDDNDDDEE